MAAMLGWFSEARARASRSKRARHSTSDASASGSIFSATSRASLVSRARYTSPMPPRPMIDITLENAESRAWRQRHGVRWNGQNCSVCAGGRARGSISAEGR